MKENRSLRRHPGQEACWARWQWRLVPLGERLQPKLEPDTPDTTQPCPLTQLSVARLAACTAKSTAKSFWNAIPHAHWLRRAVLDPTTSCQRRIDDVDRSFIICMPPLRIASMTEHGRSTAKSISSVLESSPPAHACPRRMASASAFRNVRRSCGRRCGSLQRGVVQQQCRH